MRDDGIPHTSGPAGEDARATRRFVIRARRPVLKLRALEVA